MSVKRVILCILCSTIIFAIGALCGCSKEEEKQVEEKQEFENGLNSVQNMGFAVGYKLECNQDTVFHLDVTKDLEFYATEDTEMLIAVLNYRIWDHDITREDVYKEIIEFYGADLDEKFYEIYSDKIINNAKERQNKAREVCEQYGITNDNRLTVEWVMENQYDAFHLMFGLPDPLRATVNSKYWEMYEGYNLGSKESNLQTTPKE